MQLVVKCSNVRLVLELPSSEASLTSALLAPRPAIGWSAGQQDAHQSRKAAKWDEALYRLLLHEPRPLLHLIAPTHLFFSRSCFHAPIKHSIILKKIIFTRSDSYWLFVYMLEM